MDEGLSGWKLMALAVGWVLASVMIAFVTAILVAEIARAVGISHAAALTSSFVLVFLAVVAAPVYVRRRS
jgi:uncharacterized membrane protein